MRGVCISLRLGLRRRRGFGGQDGPTRDKRPTAVRSSTNTASGLGRSRRWLCRAKGQLPSPVQAVRSSHCVARQARNLRIIPCPQARSEVEWAPDVMAPARRLHQPSLRLAPSPRLWRTRRPDKRQTPCPGGLSGIRMKHTAPLDDYASLLCRQGPLPRLFSPHPLHE